MAKSGFDGPIPGENYTSDTKNYPWHRPPEHTDLDGAIEDIFKRITDEEVAFGLISMMEMGTDLSTITDMIVTSGIGAGKWTPDFALLLAGPTAHILYLIGKGYGLDPEWGYEETDKAPSAAFFKQMKKIEEDRVRMAAQSVDLSQVTDAADSAEGLNVEQVRLPSKVNGFMAMSKDEEQTGDYPV